MYDANGRQLQMSITQQGSKTKIIDYYGGIEYVDEVLESIFF